MMELTETLLKLLEITQNAAKNSPFNLLDDLKKLNIKTFNINAKEFKYLEVELEKNIDKINDNFTSSSLFDDAGYFSHFLEKIKIDEHDYLFKIDCIAGSGFEDTINLRFKITENKINKIRELEEETRTLQKEVLADFINKSSNSKVRTFLSNVSNNLEDISYITDLLSDIKEKQLHTLNIGTKVPEILRDKPSYYRPFYDDKGVIHQLLITFDNNIVKEIKYQVI